MGGHGQKWVRPFRSYGTIKSGASHMWFDESSQLIEWFLDADSDSMIFSLTTNLFCIFHICWVPTAVLLVKNDVLLLVPTGNVLELPFSKCFLIKAWLGVKRLFPVWCNTRKNMGKDQKPRCSSCMAIEPHNLKILEFLLYGYHIPQLKNIATPAIAFLFHNFELLPIP